MAKAEISAADGAPRSCSYLALFLLLLSTVCIVAGAYGIYAGYVLDRYENQFETVQEQSCDAECKKNLQDAGYATGIWRVAAPILLIFGIYLLLFFIKIAFFRDHNCSRERIEDEESYDEESTVPVRDMVWVPDVTESVL